MWGLGEKKKRLTTQGKRVGLKERGGAFSLAIFIENTETKKRKESAGICQRRKKNEGRELKMEAKGGTAEKQRCGRGKGRRPLRKEKKV